LKTVFPNIASADLDAFFKGYLLYAKGKFAQSVRTFDTFLTNTRRANFYDAAIEKQFEMATAFLDGYKVPFLKYLGKRYEEGVKVMTHIADRMGDAPIAQHALTEVAKAMRNSVNSETPMNHGLMCHRDGLRRGRKGVALGNGAVAAFRIQRSPV